MAIRLHKYSNLRPAEEQSSNEAAISAPEHQDSSKVALYISGVILATAIMTFFPVVSRTTGS